MDSMLDDIELFKDQLISFDTAKLAKEKGFNFLTRKRYSKQGFEINVIDYYKNNRDHVERYNRDTYPCITQSLLQKWLRVHHNISIEIFAHDCNKEKDYTWSGDLCDLKGTSLDVFISSIDFPTYELALEYFLIAAMKLI